MSSTSATAATPAIPSFSRKAPSTASSSVTTIRPAKGEGVGVVGEEEDSPASAAAVAEAPQPRPPANLQSNPAAALPLSPQRLRQGVAPRPLRQQLRQ